MYELVSENLSTSFLPVRSTMSQATLKRPSRLDTNSESGTARLLGSASAAILELAVFHPVDTVAKRLMSNHGKITSSKQLSSVLFKNYVDATLTKKMLSLFPGLGYAAGYKILQRIYKYGGQPFAKDYLAKHYGDSFDRTFGKGTGRTLLHAAAGSVVGMGEIVLLPLDVLKIKRQTNPESFRGRGLFRIISDEGWGLYRGWQWTLARNAPGSFAVSVCIARSDDSYSAEVRSQKSICLL